MGYLSLILTMPEVEDCPPTLYLSPTISFLSSPPVPSSCLWWWWWWWWSVTHSIQVKENRHWEFPGCPVVRTLCFHWWGDRFNPCLENWLQVMWCGQKKKKGHHFLTIQRPFPHSIHPERGRDPCSFKNSAFVQKTLSSFTISNILFISDQSF